MWHHYYQFIIMYKGDGKKRTGAIIYVGDAMICILNNEGCLRILLSGLKVVSLRNSYIDGYFMWNDRFRMVC